MTTEALNNSPGDQLRCITQIHVVLSLIIKEPFMNIIIYVVSIKFIIKVDISRKKE